MNYRNHENTQSLIKRETREVLKVLDTLVDRHIYISGDLEDLLEIDTIDYDKNMTIEEIEAMEDNEDISQEQLDKITEYVQDTVVENVINNDIFKEFISIFGVNKND